MQSRALKRTSLSLFDAPAYCDVPLAPRVPERTEIWLGWFLQEASWTHHEFLRELRDGDSAPSGI
jgi:hypothetical protein